MITTNTWVRDTLINVDVYNSLPAERQQGINKLVAEFQTIPYIDARTEIGPDQYARMSDKRRNEISQNACKVFAIEQQIKLLLRSNAQIVADEQKAQAQKLAERIRYLTHRKQTIEDFCSRRLNSKRNNTTKQEYQEVVQELEMLKAAVYIPYSSIEVGKKELVCYQKRITLVYHDLSITLMQIDGNCRLWTVDKTGNPTKPSNYWLNVALDWE
jgi:hypothetical protein